MTFFHKAMRKLPTSKAVVGRVDTLQIGANACGFKLLAILFDLLFFVHSDFWF
jgi:hypothetical protein